ncbi:hypothetical protein HKX48_004657 [Thoreauomyces humboldtii]|nr:hypothetical protein HKX48_004657 [Thoreauomyces humboldtii]
MVKSPKSPMRKRIRRTPLKQRVTDAPFDLLMLALEFIAMVDWEDIFRKSSYVIALLLNLAYLFVRFYEGGDVTQELWASEFDEGHHPSTLDAFMNSLELTIIIICTANTVYLFTRSKTYLLFKQPIQPNIRTPSDMSWRIRSPHATIVTVDVSGAVTEDEADRTWKTRLLERLAIWRKPGVRVSSQAPMTTRRVWQLKTWNPSPGSMNLFCWFSPIQVAIMNNVTSSNWQYYLPLTCICSMITYFLITSFQELLQDREILSGQVLHEFSDDMYKLDNYPPPRAFDIITRGLNQTAIVTTAALEDDLPTYDREYTRQLEVATEWVAEQPDPEEYADPNLPDPEAETRTPRRSPVAEADASPSFSSSFTPSRRRNDENQAPADKRSPEKSHENVFQASAGIRRKVSRL